MHRLPSEIAGDLEDLLDDFAAMGIRPTASQYDAQSFGNYVVDLAGDRVFRITRDRYQYILYGPAREELEKVDLWRAYDDLGSFRRAVLKWLGAVNGPGRSLTK